MRYFQSLLLLVFSYSCLLSQYNHIPVFTDLEDDLLLENLIEVYKPFIIPNYDNARDILFGTIYNEDQILSCVYTGHSVTLEEGADPTVSAYQNGSSDGINTEHAFPRSKGAEFGNALSDMHHLYPTRSIVNSSRGADRFDEIPDDETMDWFYLNNNLNSIPTKDIDLYSEDINGAFEPREDFKGNIARAMFYFYTMYKAEADAADANFFESQRSVLCDWHIIDPVDQKEWERNEMIGEYQESKVNPFILDCSLAARTYCDNIDEACSILNNNENFEEHDIRIFPNPTSSEITISVPNQNFIVQVFNCFGKLIYSGNASNMVNVLLNDAHGNYIVRLTCENGSIYSQFVTKF